MENASYEEALKIQLKRDEIEQWLHRPMFEKTLKGCLVKVSLGASGDTREIVYRCCDIVSI
jgi:hypothetical protein